MSGTQLLLLPPERQAPRSPGSDRRPDLHLQVPQDWCRQRGNRYAHEYLPWLCPQGSAEKEQAKMAISYSFPGKAVAMYFISGSMKVWLLSSSVSCLLLSSPGPKRANEHFLHHLPLANSNNKTKFLISSLKGLVHTPSVPTFTAVIQGLGSQITSL